MRCPIFFPILFLIIFAAQPSPAAFERIQLSARSTGVGGASVALTSGANSVPQNVAGLAGLVKSELALSYLELYGLLNYNAAFVAIPILSKGQQKSAIGFRLTSSTDTAGAYQEIELGCAIGRQIFSTTSVGFGLSYLTSQANLGLVQVGTGRGLAIDVGILHQLINQRIVVGASITNLLSYVDYGRKQVGEIQPHRYVEILKPHFRFGGIIMLDLLFDRLEFSTDSLISPVIKKTLITVELANRRFSLGLESKIQHGYLRFGYRHNGGLDQGFCTGFGYQFRQFQIDYGWADGRFNSASHLISITLCF